MVWTVRSRRRWAAILVVCALLASLIGASTSSSVDAQSPTIYDVNDRLGTGVNLGNALEGPREGEWGLRLRQSFFPTIAEAGFRHVRVPIRFSAYTGGAPGYEIPDGIDPTVPFADNLWDRIDWVIANAEQNGLYVILDFHLYDEISDDVAGERAKFLAIWRQIAERYADASPWVLFELLNEPHGQFNDNPELLNALYRDALNIIRQTNPTRPVLVGPMYWNGIAALDTLDLPNDPNLIVSVHFYDPFDFTHQGASWVDPIPPAPARFVTDIVDFGAGWWDGSWRSTVTPGPDSLRVEYFEEYAGLAFGRVAALNPASLRFVVTGAAELDIRCESDNGVEVEVREVTTVRSRSTYNVDMTSCPDATQIIKFMASSETFDTLEFYEIELCLANGRCTRLIENGAQAIESAFDAAAAWGQDNNRPMNVGEFGAFSANGLSDMGDRADWTARVRSAGRARGLSLSYWEFGSGFGVYDPTTNTWVQPLLNALALPPQVVTTPTPQPLTCQGLAVTIVWGSGATATNGDDVIAGTSGADVIDAGAGNDTVCAGGGNDVVVGGTGNDTLIGGAGQDVMRGNEGVDVLEGGAGNDRLLGGVDNDRLVGGEGHDYLGGFGGDDMIWGGPGDETIFGGFGADIIQGGDGDDSIYGLIGNDTILGGNGNDWLQGDRGQDTINGGAGNDTINGGNGDDVLGGDGGNDSVNGGQADDQLSGGGGSADVCAGNKENVADTADATCEQILGTP